MSRLLSVIVVAATTVLVPLFAVAGNQEIADQISQTLKHNGKLSDYRIAVKFQDGAATLKGRVASQTQMNTVLKLVYETPGVSRVVNELSIGKSETTTNAKTISSADKVSASYKQSSVRQTSASEPDKLLQQHVGSNAPRPISNPMPMRVAMNQNRPAQDAGVPGAAPRPMYSAAAQSGVAPVRYDQACMPNYAWPSYAAYPNYAALTYPRQYSPTAWPYIGPFYPYPQVPLGWRKVTMEWKDGWWFLDFKDEQASCWR